ncbi:MAG: AAA family ATPase [Fibrobacter sp.]|jgi:hypothetical protein|nr:AAA family ATPase [Fibrobacter sp.]
METPKHIINRFIKDSHSEKEIKDALFKAAEAAQKEGWTYMETVFQLGGKAKDEGLDDEQVQNIVRRVFSSERRSQERERAIQKQQEAQAAAVAASAGAAAAQVNPAAQVMVPANYSTAVFSSMAALSIDQLLSLGLDSKSLELLQNHRIDPESLSIPWPTQDWRKDLSKLLEALFLPGEYIDFKVSNTSEISTEKVSVITDQSDAIRKVMKSLDGAEGALISVNASRGSEDEEDNERWRYRYAVVESPKMTLTKQLAYYKALNLPCAALVNTGANSVQAWILIDAGDREQYDDRVDFLFSTLESQGFRIDLANRSPNYMARMPGVLRNGKQQYLISLKQGAKSFTEWQDWVEYSLDGKPLIELASDSEHPPKKEAAVIENVLNAGEFLLLSAPRKSGKSYALIDLALSVCYEENWLGLDTAAHDVLYINLDSTKAAFLNRLHLIAGKRGLKASTPRLGFLNLHTAMLTPLEIAQLIAKRVQGAQKLEGHAYRLIIIDPLTSVLYHPKITRSAGEPHQLMMQMLDSIIGLTGCAVVAALNSDEYPQIAARADSLITLTPMEGRPHIFQIRGEFRENQPLPIHECTWRFPRFLA